MFIFRWLRILGSLFFIMPSMAFSEDLSGTARTSQLTEATVGLENFPDSLDPRSISFSPLEQSLEHLLFLPLFSASPNGLPQQVLAESYRFENPLRLNIKVRSGIRFANGREIDAEDIVATYRKIVGDSLTGRESPRKGMLSNIASIRSVSRRTVHIDLKAPDASILSQLSVGIVPREVVLQSDSPDAAKTSLLGLGAESGPFILSEFGRREITLARNKRYTGAPYGGSLPTLAKVRLRLFGSRQAIYDALIAGEVNIVQNSLDYFQVSKLKSKHSVRFQVQQVVANETWYLAFNFRKKILADLRVRRAIALAIDRKEILNFSLAGAGTPAKSIFPPRNYFYPESLASISPSTREARLLLDAAGAIALKSSATDSDDKATPRHFTIGVPLEKGRVAIAKAIAGQLKLVGLNVGVEVSEYPEFVRKVRAGELDAWIAPWAGFRDGDFLRFALHSKSRPPTGANSGHYSNKELDKTLDKALQTSSQSRRKELYNHAQLIVSKSFPYVFLWHGWNFAVIDRSFRGFEVFPDGRLTSLSSVRAR